MSRRSKFSEVSLSIERLSHEGRGIAKYNDKTAMVRFALPGEEVVFKPKRYRAKVYEGVATQIEKASELRIKPACSHFGVCGGCDLQHLSVDNQLLHKSETLRSHLNHFGKIKDIPEISLLEGPSFNYRHKARLGVKYLKPKEKLVVGFREALSNFVTDSSDCKIMALPDGFLSALQEALEKTSIKAAIPQVEVAVSNEGITLIIRHLEPISHDDESILVEYAKSNNVYIWLQSGGYDTLKPLLEEMPKLLSYKLPNFGVSLYFSPEDFTQINPEINQKMVSQAVDWLDLNKGDEVLDLFCGIGNFSLPIASQGVSVTGVELCEKMVEKAKYNANINSLDAKFYAQDLTKPNENKRWEADKYNKLLIDPPRSGAKEVLSALSYKNIERIVYVSCNSATFAHDAGILVNECGYSLEKLSVMDMFPHTKHVEVMALFVRN